VAFRLRNLGRHGGQQLTSFHGLYSKQKISPHAQRARQIYQCLTFDILNMSAFDTANMKLS